MYYVVYRHKEVIDGPLLDYQARHICEDLTMLFEDSRYEVLHEDKLGRWGLGAHAKHCIHEDQPHD